MGLLQEATDWREGPFPACPLTLFQNMEPALPSWDFLPAKFWLAVGSCYKDRNYIFKQLDCFSIFLQTNKCL